MHQSLILKSFRLPSDYCESPHLSVLDILNEKNEGDIQYKEQEEGSIRIPILVEGQSHTNIDSDFETFAAKNCSKNHTKMLIE